MEGFTRKVDSGQNASCVTLVHIDPHISGSLYAHGLDRAAEASGLIDKEGSVKDVLQHGWVVETVMRCSVCSHM